MESTRVWFTDVIASVPAGGRYWRDHWDPEDPEETPALLISYEKDGMMYALYSLMNNNAKNSVYPDREAIIVGIQYNLTGHHQTRDDSTAQGEMRYLLNRLLNSVTWDSAGLR